MGDKDEEHGNLEGDVPIKSGRWSATEDAALFQGVRDHLASLGLEPQPPVNLPSEMELRKHNECMSGALTTTSLQGYRREPFSGAITEDSTFFDSIVDASYYVDGIDGPHGFSVETHPLVSASAMPHSGSSGTPRSDALDVGNSIARTPSEASTVVTNGSQLSLEHFYEQHPHTKFSVDSSGQTSLSGALFEALSVAASHIRTPVKRDQSDTPQNDSGDSSGGDETISGQTKGDQQVQSASLAAWPHPLQLPPSPRAFHQPVDVSRHAWTYPGFLQTADTQQGSHQIVSHPQHNSYSTLTCSQSLSIPTNISFNLEAPLMQPTAMVLTQQQRGNNFDSGKILAVDDYWHPPSTLHLDSIVDTKGDRSTHFLDRVDSTSIGNGHLGNPDETDPLNYLEHPEDYSHCTKVPSKLADQFKRTRYQLPNQHHPLLYPPSLNFTRSPSTRHSHPQSPLSFSLPPSSCNSPRLSSVAQLSKFSALDNGPDQYIHNSSTGACKGASRSHFEQMDDSLHHQGHVHDISTDLNPRLTHESNSLPETRESYALAISRAMTTCPWNKITRQSIPDRTGVQAQARWSEALDPQVKKGKWSPEEDVLLLKGVQESHKCWIWIADGIPGRTQRQCRTRWVQICTRAEREAAAAALALAKSQARGLCAL
ncbi:hypothetical protein KVV02_000846 [Mortierella alpina]|uniref:Uncharacterized protein n=1 Tax=Mortierella alpina TaxID=64518 RepID=A0A9P8A3S2_MORAP|nr:hypothetical protein KVV02_000846 [Mortierella alpina]